MSCAFFVANQKYMNDIIDFCQQTSYTEKVIK
jgi:hypothetical protein